MEARIRTGGTQLPAASGRGARLSRFERACLAVVAASFLFRLHHVAHPVIIWDSAWYLTLARSFGETGTFLLPWYETPVYSGYWPPLFPVFASPLVALLGPSYSTLVVASTLASALLVLATFLTTRDLLGRTRAFAAATLVAVNPAFLVSDSRGMSESVLALAVVLAAWAFLRSLDRPAWLPLAALFGFLAYLGKASLGVPLVAAGLVALAAWRVWTRGWRRVARSPVDVGVGVGAFALLGVLASTRSGKLGGVGVGLIEPVRATLSEPLWIPVFLFKLAFAATFLLAVTLPFSLRVAGAARAARTERASALWLATLVPLAAGAVFTTSFYFYERRQLVDFDNVRYLTPSIVPFLWLVLPHWPADAHAAPPGRTEGLHLRRRHDRLFLAALGLVALLLLLSPMAATASLPRLYALLLLGLVPLALGLMALRSRVDAVPRRTAKGETEHRYVPAPAPRATRAGVAVGLAVALVALLLAWYVSSWYVGVALGLAVALAAQSPRAQAVAMALVLLAATAPGRETPAPFEQAGADMAAMLPEGSVVHVTDTAVYFAAVAPESLVVREGVPPDASQAEAILFIHLAGGDPAPTLFPGYRFARSWDYEFDYTPPLQARIWVEETLLGFDYEERPSPALTLFVREDVPLAGAA